MAKWLFHPEAEAEYTEAIRWYEERSLRAAARFEAEIDSALNLISADPE